MSTHKAQMKHRSSLEEAIEVEEEEKGCSSTKIDACAEAGHPRNPVNWSASRKWTIVGVLSAMRLTIVLGTLICAPAAPSIVADLGSGNASDQNLLTSIWELGEACGPLFAAPMSELFGRAPIYNIANIGFVVFSIGGAVSRNIQSVLVFRFFQGATVASIVLDPCVIGDLFVAEERGNAMVIGMIAALIGPTAGPVVGGYISGTIGWRWTFWLPAIMGGVCELLFMAVFRETYWPRILQKLSKDSRGEEAPSTASRIAAKQAFGKAIIRPVVMFCRSPVLMCMATYVALVYGFFYLLLTSIEEAFQDAYGFSTGTASLSFISNGIGKAIGLLVCRTLLDKLIKSKQKPGEIQVEGRIIPIAIAGVILPVGFVLYGWTLDFQVHWVAPMIGFGLIGFSTVLITIPSFAYLVDVFGRHSASAVAASVTLRCITGAVIPLAAPALYRSLGQGWGNSVLGLLSLALLPMPLLLIRFGERLRRWTGALE